MSDNVKKFNEYQEFKTYEERLKNLKERDYTEAELEERKVWAEKWAEPND